MAGMPTALMPGPARGYTTVPSDNSTQQHLALPQAASLLDPDSSNSSLPEGARSPAISESSHYTSISQRGINPNWQPGQPYAAPQQQQMRRDVLLGANPDFVVPGAGPGRGGMGGRTRGGPTGRYPGAI